MHFVFALLKTTFYLKMENYCSLIILRYQFVRTAIILAPASSFKDESG